MSYQPHFFSSTLKTFNMQLQTAERKKAKIKMCFQGPSGSGKTYSSLLLAYGLCNDWEKVSVICTENHSSELYSHLGRYKVINMSSPFTPEKYIEAITICEKAGMKVLIIDSTTHEWEYLLDYHSSLAGNSFTNWNKVTPRHNDFVRKILQSQCHIISTVRTKTDYVLTEKNGKTIPEKVGLKSVQRDSMEYEYTLVFDLDMKNFATASKDRTGLFFGKPSQVLNGTTGQLIAEWCNSGVAVDVDYVSQRIVDTSSIHDLLALYQQYPQYKSILQNEYEKRKRQIMLTPQEPSSPIFNPQSLSTNGVH